MKVHVEIQIRLKLSASDTLHDVLAQFARETGNWWFPKTESATYQQHIGGEAGYLICRPDSGIKPALVALAPAQTKRPHTYYVANIVPQDCSELTLVEYNGVAVAVAKDFRKWLRKSSFAGSVQSTDGNKNLGDIIPGEKCRKFFERFLNSSQWDSAVLPSHPSDIEKLDVFICAVFRHGAAVDVSEIERFLIADRKWKPADAAWVRVRINAGLDMLKVDRNF